MKIRILWNDIKGNRLLAVYLAFYGDMRIYVCIDLFSVRQSDVVRRYVNGKGADTGFSANARRSD